MAQTNINLSVGKNNFSKSKVYNNIYENVQEIDNSDGFINVLSVSDTKAANTVSSIKALCVYNQSNVGIELQFTYNDWKDNSNVDEGNAVDLGSGSTSVRFATMLLPAGDFIYLPNGRILGYNADASGANATSISNTAPDSNEYTVVDASGANEAIDDSETEIDVDDDDFFKRGDLIRIDDEIMEVTSISGNTLTVIRGTHGSTAVAHDITDDLRLPFFNAYNNFNKYSVAQTNKNGKFKAMNFFGYGRTATTFVDGIVAGSVAFKFYNQGYQELGLSGITPNTPTGLVASTEYMINITVDGGSVFADLSFTTDSSNTNFGGKNGMLNKIQDALDTQYYTAGNLFEKRITVGIVDGDVRFTSGSHLSSSAILLATPTTSGKTPFGIGRIPAIGSIESPVAARLPDDTLFDKVTYQENPNIGAFMYDDGAGNLLGAGTGTINYETGAVDFTSLPNAEFVISATYVSAHSGAPSSSGGGSANQLLFVGARSVNQKLNATIKVIALN